MNPVSSDIGAVATGTSLPRVAFFWPNGSGDQKVALTVKAGGTTYTGQVTFNLLKPTSAFGTFSRGTAGLSQDGSYVGLYGANAPDGIHKGGINFQGSVKLPDSFANAASQGHWGLLQLILPHRVYDFVDGTHQETKPQGAGPIDWGLDSYMPYKFFNAGTGSAPLDGNLYAGVDTPRLIRTGDHQGETNMLVDDHFEMFQYYVLPGTESRRVALSQVNWAVHAHATGTNGNLATAQDSTSSNSDLPGVPNEPTWSQLWTGKTVDPQ